MLNYNDRGVMFTLQAKDTQDWSVETIAFYYSATAPIAGQAQLGWLSKSAQHCAM